jgi:uncharacterized protein YjbI with pentapeptide repeats
MNTINPLQIACQKTVVEQDNRFHLVISATIGFRLSDGSVLLEMDAMSESIAAMGGSPMPDFGMPKPKAEYLVSGSYHAPDSEAVRGGEVKVEFGRQSKTLVVFGDRSWQMGIPSEPELITKMPLEYTRAYGGSDYPKNPVGIGYKQEQLPNIENPDQLLTFASANIQPAGLGPIDLVAEQKRRFQGTYDDSYLQKFYPGYPVDFDWHCFMNGAEDQWSQEYYAGDETFALHNLHPQQPLISGKLPGYMARCFAQMEDKSELKEINLNLDTVWFFPAADLGLLIWRGGFDVDDDEAAAVKHLMLAYENQKDTPRDRSHYDTAFASLVSSKDPLLSQLSSDDLIPVDEKCAMQILQDNALQDSEESEFSKNMDAKAKTMAALTTEKVDEAIKEMKAGMPVDAPAQSQELLDLEKMLKNPPPLETDADMLELNQILEKILPGITAGDPKKLQLKGFTFDKIDEIMLAVDKFTQKKQTFAMAQVEKATGDMRANLDQQLQSMGPEASEATKNIQESLAQLDAMENPPPSPLPRLNANAILAGLDQLAPQTLEAMQHLQNQKAMGADDETTRQIEEMIRQTTLGQDQEMKQRMLEVEADFKLMYRDIAHFQVDGVAPHKISVEDKRQAFLDALSSGQAVRGQDWSCIDLSGLQLDGIDLSDAYLEQVDLSGASLRNANFSGAILARAKLDAVDMSGSNFENANIGAVSARGANFADCILSSAKLSKGNFSNAIFTNARLNAVEILEIVIDEADFSGAESNGFQFIDIEMQGVNFSGAQLTSAAFLQCRLNRCNFSSAQLPTSVWADCALILCNFEQAQMTGACFASTDPEKGKLEQTSFVGACLDRANFQGVDMQRSDLSAASMINANFSSANLYGANLSGAIAHNAQFRKAILTNASLEKIDLREGSLAKTHMTGANISGANLYAVDFLRSTMGDTLFDGCNLDRTIIQHWRPS